MRNLWILIGLLWSLNSIGQQLQEHVYWDGAQELNGLVAVNGDQLKPAVLILPAWKGVDEEAKNAAMDLEKEGYWVFIADIYGKGNIPNDNKEAAQKATYYKNNYQAYQHRILLALKELEKMGAQKIAVIGYCFGGTGALEVARAGFNVKGVVSIHGGLAKAEDRSNVKITTSVLVQHPADDKSVSAQDVQNFIKEMNEGNADWQMITYAHCGHTFTNPAATDYNFIMAERAWKHLLLFLKEVLHK